MSNFRNENVCEHGDHPAPLNKRFCSTACERCEHESRSENGCDNLCGLDDLNVEVRRSDSSSCCVTHEVWVDGKKAGIIDRVFRHSEYKKRLPRGRRANLIMPYCAYVGSHWGNFHTLGRAVGWIIEEHMNDRT